MKANTSGLISSAWIIASAFLLLPTNAFAPRIEKDSSFDYLLLAQFWPTTSCVFFESEHKHCYVPPSVTGWTIHGLWPSRPHTEEPDYCNNSLKFDFSQIKSLSASLATNWPYYAEEGPKTELWEHEWTKHGTCAYTLPLLKGELNYFNQTLSLHSRLKTYEILKAGNITPSMTEKYNPEDVFKAIKARTGYIPNVTCYRDKGDYYLEQIWLCFDKQLNQINCPDVSYSKKKDTSLYFESMEAKSKFASDYLDCPTGVKVWYKPLPRNQ